jgi:hypothetical protein
MQEEAVVLLREPERKILPDLLMPRHNPKDRGCWLV